MNGNVIPDTISGSCGRACRLEFLSPYADDEAANRPVLLHQLSDATDAQWLVLFDVDIYEPKAFA